MTNKQSEMIQMLEAGLASGEIEMRKVSGMQLLDTDMQDQVSAGKKITCVFVWNGWGFFCK